MNTTRISIIVLAIIVIIGAGLLESGLFGSPDAVDTSEWEVYENELFSFSLRVPPGWVVEEFLDDAIAPGVNVYPETVDESPPFIHHSDVTNVSVFPRGIPTEGVFGETVETDVTFTAGVQDAYDFVLADGERWATFATFSDVPDSWQAWGFLWARVSSEEIETVCLRNGETISEFECDLIAGDVIVHRGSIAEEDRRVQQAILESFRFIE